MVSSRSPTISHYSAGFERSIIASVCTRMAIDVSSYDIQHVKIDTETNRYQSTMKSGLNHCLTVSANKDQTGRAFIEDVVLSMFDEGFVALVPVDTDTDPEESAAFDILSMRTGKIQEWYPNHVRVEVYNDRNGIHQSIMLPKSTIAIVENPLYSIMNEPNSTLKRLIRKLTLLDNMDETLSSGKLDLIIQLPYVVKTETRQKQAEERRKAIEQQLAGSQYGIAYIDGTERVTQLNRAAENHLLSQVTYLTNMLYNQLGISEAIFNGTADKQAMLNYYNRTIEPIVMAIVDELNRKFITKTGRAQGQRVMAYRDVFKLMPADEIAEIADTLTRNEIVSANEMRSKIGMKPSDDPMADELRNANMPDDGTGVVQEEVDPGIPRADVEQMLRDQAEEFEKVITEILDGVQKTVDEAIETEDATLAEDFVEDAKAKANMKE